MKTRYAKTMRDAIAEVWANDITLDEGRMKTIATMFDAGKTPEEIAKKMKLPVATVKSILGEEDLPEEMLWEFTDQQITQLKKEYSGLKGAKISLARANQLRNIFDKISNTQLPKLYKADIPFLSTMALTRMIKKGIQVPKGIKLSAFEQMSWEQITETHTSDQSSKNIQKDKNENAPSEADIDRLKKQGLKPTKEETMKLRNGTKVLDKVFPNMTMARNAASAYMQQNKGKKADGYQSPFNNRFYVRLKEETELKEYAEYIEYMCKNSSQARAVANMFKGKTGGGEANSDGSEVRIDSAKDVENIHKQVMAKYGDDIRVITKEENIQENSSVMKGVDDYIKIGQDRIKNHPRFKDLYAKQKRDYMKSVGPKYIKIHDTENGQKRSIHAFIDKQTGDLFKPAGVNAPAKGVRGNVTDKNFMSKLKGRFDTHGGHLYARDPYRRIFGSVQESDITKDNVKKGDSEKEKELKIKLDKEKDQDTLEKQLIAAQGQINILKQKLENEKNKAIKPEPNPDTGEVPLAVGLAQKLLRDKEKKETEKPEIKKEDLNKDDEKTIKPIIKQLKKSVTAHDKQAKDLEKAVKEETIVENSKKDKEKRLQRAKDMIRYYDMLKKKALKGPNKELAKKMLKSDVEKDIEEGGPGSGPQHGDKRGTYKTGHKKSYMKPGAGKRPGSAKDGGQTDKEADDYDTEMGEADLTKSQIKKVHKMADELPKKSFRDRYGKEKGDAVRYGTATNMVKKKMKIENSKHPAKMKYEEIAGLRKKADKSGMPYGILKKVYDRGMAAWKGGHRPGASQHQWAFARVNSFVTKSSGTWGGADKDLAAKVKGK
jgi:hypothetical protein|tara:strand:- start:2027 stop:4510 length:2484 start_codon:yes stop_codon:yes gene_type:complete